MTEEKNEIKRDQTSLEHPGEQLSPHQQKLITKIKIKLSISLILLIVILSLAYEYVQISIQPYP